MGRVKNGILDGFPGTIGTVIGGNWRGVQYMRARSQNKRHKTTQAQEEQRAKFALAIKYGTAMLQLPRFTGCA